MPGTTDEGIDGGACNWPDCDCTEEEHENCAHPKIYEDDGEGDYL